VYSIYRLVDDASFSVNRERVVDKILQYAFSSNEASPQSSPSKMDAQQPPQITP
jgi:hypothetical protein